ncbi:unnamed protein product [Peniophora sp. CBMAI 1063]|nr:unnamed protein product [Peniophora sp. CBMAI 1063]
MLKSITLYCSTPGANTNEDLFTSSEHVTISNHTLRQCFVCHTARLCHNIVSLRISDVVVQAANYVPVFSGMKACKELVLDMYNPVALNTQLRLWRSDQDRKSELPDVEILRYTDEEDELPKLLEGSHYDMTTDLYLDAEYSGLTSMASWDLKTKMPALRTLHIAQDSLENARPRYMTPTRAVHEGAQCVKSWPPVVHLESSLSSAHATDKAATVLREWLAQVHQHELALEELYAPPEAVVAMDAIDAENSARSSWREVVGEVQAVS